MVRLAQTLDLPARLPVDVVLVEHRDVADREDDVGAAARQLVERRDRCARIVGSLRITCVTQGPILIRLVRAEAAAKISQPSLW